MLSQNKIQVNSESLVRRTDRNIALSGWAVRFCDVRFYTVGLSCVSCALFRMFSSGVSSVKYACL